MQYTLNRKKSIQVSNKHIPIYGFFILIAIALVAAGLIHQRAAHFFFDGIAIRDSGTMLDYLVSLKPIDSAYCILQHVEGPLQFFFLNFYAHTIGNFLPLSPSVMQFPNSVFIFVTCVILLLIGKRLVKPGSGYLFSLCFVLSPWIVVCLRMPWYFNTMSVLMQASTVYFLIVYLEENPPRVSKLMAPLSLALYMTTGMDWPIFFTFLGIFFIIIGAEQRKKILLNKYNVFPLSMVVYHLVVPLIFFVYYGGWDGARQAMLFYPFAKTGQLTAWPSWNAIFSNTLGGIGLQIFFAIACIIFIAIKIQHQKSNRTVQSSFAVAVCFWFCISAFAVLKTSATPQYVYVMAVPTAILCGMLLARFGRLAQLACITAMVAILVLVMETPPYASTFIAPNSDDRHVLATAGFILENYPELLTKEKTVFVPRERPACVSQYLRGLEKVLVMPANFPAEMRIHSVASPKRALDRFLESYTTDNKILADWLILDSDLFADGNPSKDFFIRMKNDRNICWLGRLTQGDGDTLYVGRVCAQSDGPIEKAPEIDVDRYAELYSRKYDKISFLKHNIDKIMHY